MVLGLKRRPPKKPPGRGGRVQLGINGLIHLPHAAFAYLGGDLIRAEGGAGLKRQIKTPVGIKLSGPDLDVLQELGQNVEAVVRNVPGTLSVYAERVMGATT